MAYVDAATLADGAVISAAIWNREVVNNTIFLHSPPYARIDLNALQDISTGTTEIVQFDANTDDNDSMVDLANNRLVIQTAGMYMVTATIALQTTSGTGDKYVQLVSSSGVIIASLAVDHATNQTFHTVTGQAFFAVGESVTTQVYLSAGSAPDVLNGSYMAAHWLRGALS